MPMPTFQDQIEIDLEEVFFNAPAKEVVTSHKIGGIIKGRPAVECQIVVDRELYRERMHKDDIENVSLNGLVFYIKESDWIKKFKHIPKIKSALTFDGERYIVLDVADDMGMLDFTIKANRGR